MKGDVYRWPARIGNRPLIWLDLLKQGHGFSFFQALRLLRRCGGAGEESPGDREGADRSLRIRPDLSLGFPASDVARIEETPGGPAGYRVTVSFLGLYGASSPLPTFYTEDLIDEMLADSTTTRDFLDIFHHQLISSSSAAGRNIASSSRSSKRSLRGSRKTVLPDGARRTGIAEGRGRAVRPAAIPRPVHAASALRGWA